MNPKLPEKPMTTEEMAARMDRDAMHYAMENPTLSTEYTAIARRLRLLEAVAKTSSRRLTESGFTMVPVGAATPDNPIFIAYRDARQALSADERGGKEGEDAQQ